MFKNLFFCPPDKQKIRIYGWTLANVKPVVAYELSRTAYMEALSQDAVRILQNPDYTRNHTKEYKEGFESGVNASKKHIYQEFEKMLVNEIKILSWSTDFFTFFSCRHKILKIKKKFSAQQTKIYLENYFKKTISPLMEQYKNKN